MQVQREEECCIEVQQRGGKANRSNICYKEMESMSKLLKTVKQNVRSLVKVKARKKEVFSQAFSSMLLWELEKPGELATLECFLYYCDKSVWKGVYLVTVLDTQVSEGHISKVTCGYERKS